VIDRLQWIGKLNACFPEAFLFESFWTQSELSCMKQSVIDVQNQHEFLGCEELNLFIINMLCSALNQSENLLKVAHESELSVLALHILAV
jgi:hypothetical protein